MAKKECSLYETEVLNTVDIRGYPTVQYIALILFIQNSKAVRLLCVNLSIKKAIISSNLV